MPMLHPRFHVFLLQVATWLSGDVTMDMEGWEVSVFGGIADVRG
jgi:hypothetical protein